MNIFIQMKKEIRKNVQDKREEKLIKYAVENIQLLTIREVFFMFTKL